ncbi:chemotaxis protein [Paenibacillus sp. SYP-B3998]|uniref:Glucanase n=1 Tax=Paenibacillus sp. SYP-B3998 TaxID=2678564 RepID=A0A6G4A5H4_9BACL|nr:chemotaxis protein [Paenibacillus sp. SYP-B3998]
MEMTKVRPVKNKLKVWSVAVLCVTFLTASFLSPALEQKAEAAGEQKPFPQQVNYTGITKPNHVTQTQLNSDVASYYNSWKSSYLKNDLSSLPGGYYIKGNITGGADGYKPLGSSEGQGYGMVITALMAGYDTNAKTIYDGLFKTARAYKSSANGNLMGWVVADAKAAQGHFDSATDGDVDIAYSLILAHYQWGSTGTINYLAEAKKMITDGIKVSNVTTNNRLNLGDWDEKNALNTRPSDWMLSHLRAFYEVTGDQTWLNVINNLYSVYTSFSASYSPNTGLISDFVVGNPPQPAPRNFLDEFPETDEYNYNASRVPLRIVMDYGLYGDTRGKAIADKMATWIKGKTGGNPDNIKDGYKLNGAVTGSASGSEGVFVAPLIAAATSNSSNQAWINAGWDWMKSHKTGYYSDSFSLLNMLFISGNWWKPVAGGSPDTQAPSVPGNLTVTGKTASSVSLSWNASTDNVGVTSYEVYNGATLAASVPGTSATVSGLSASTTYTFTVKAKDAAGNQSGVSNTTTATTNNGPTQPTNLALNKAGVSSSNETTSVGAAKAFDGNATTRWASVEGADPQWIYVDLGATKNINRVKLNWEAAYAKGYKIQVSTDSASPSNWTDVYSTTTGNGAIDDLTITAQDARYVRMYGTVRGTSYGYSLYEFEVYGTDVTR